MRTSEWMVLQFHPRGRDQNTILIQMRNNRRVKGVKVAIEAELTLHSILLTGQRKSNAFLDVPSINMNHLQVSDNEDDTCRLRTFSSSKGGEYKDRYSMGG